MSGLVCEGLAVAVPGQPVLGTVSACLAAGRVTALLGPNGAGKSTLLSLLSGQHRPRAGQVWLDGRAVADIPPAQLARQRAVMVQDTSAAFDFTVREVVEMGRFAHRHAPSPHEAQLADRAMQATGVQHLAERGVQRLSGGERARAQLARALVQIWEPPACAASRWLLLDEPTAALDLAHQHQALALLRRWAREQGVGVVAVLHDLNLALRYADDALVLPGQGHAPQAGPVAQVLTPSAISGVWGVPCTLVSADDGVSQVLMAGGDVLPI